MKTIALAITLVAAAYGQAHAQTHTPTRFGKDAVWLQQQRQLSEQRQQNLRLQQQQRDIQQLQQEQRRARVDAEDAAFIARRPVLATPTAAPRFTPTARDRVFINRQIQRTMADPNLSHAQKMAMTKRLLDAIEP